ncbi:MAG: ExbD/TolR family protein [Vulcanimicrobiota bacterium]
MRRRRGVSPPESEPTMAAINITPLTDVLLVLLIIFLVAATAAHQNVFQLDLAGEVASVEVSDARVAVVGILADGSLRHEGQASSLEELAARLGSDEQVVLEPVPEARYGRLVEVMDWLRSRGFEKVSLAQAREAESR